MDDLIPNICYSATHKSFVEELIAGKSHSSSCVEADKILLYDHLDKALFGGLLELVLQAHEDNKDSQTVTVKSNCNMEVKGNGRKHTRS